MTNHLAEYEALLRGESDPKRAKLDKEKEEEDDDDQDDDFHRAMHAMFGVTQHVVTKENDADQRPGDEKRFLPLEVPEGIDVQETRLEYEVEQGRSRLQLLSTIVSLLLHVRHGDPMEEFFHKQEQTWCVVLHVYFYCTIHTRYPLTLFLI